VILDADECSKLEAEGSKRWADSLLKIEDEAEYSDVSHLQLAGGEASPFELSAFSFELLH
jgi:hypothetical protein